MSFITKRERVFNEYDLFDLPARNEGKLKAYASCTDARAWSHFCSDKTEHLVEVIKRNNETCRPKYVPTTVIVDTLMVAKNAEIARLKNKIEEFEQMLAAYDQLELSCDQKCEIVVAHAAIKAANKELDEMYLDLDLSGFTEGLDSEAFETGKSRGDGEEEQAVPTTDVKNYQMGETPTCDIGTFVTDPRIDEMQDIIVGKDAKLNAMKNTIAVMENDVCEPYCIYAHIYTALEKIFGILCQNDKYRHYLNLLTAGKDTRSIDITGKILFKLKVLEKFSVALIAPCNRELPAENSNHDCECYRTQVITRIETNYAVTTTERQQQPSTENKRAHLVADIIENEEMKDMLSKQSFTIEQGEENPEDIFDLDDYNINRENLDRLKKLQENYDDLMVCYESLKHEKESLETRCCKYEDLEKEFEKLKLQVNEYNSLWNEKEHYRKRSADLDILKEQYLILTDETTNLETQLKAESEINNMKCKTIEELRNENIQLEKKLNEAIIAFEKEKNYLLCKLKEADCTVMCQGQQIKSLSTQIDRLLEQDKKSLQSYESNNTSIALIDEVESNRDQIKNLKEALFCNEEENVNLQQQYQNQLQLITELRSELEDWKSAYEKTLQRNDYLEKYTASLIEENKDLSQDAKEKTQAIDNLMKMVDNKSQEINKLISESEKSKNDNNDLCKQISKLQLDYDNSLASLENEKRHALTYLQLARAESQELLDKVKNYDQILHSTTDLTKSLQVEIENKKGLLINAVEDNNKLKLDLASRDSSNSVLVQEIERLREINEYRNKQYNTALELSRKESSQLKMKLSHYETLQLQLQSLQDSHEKLIEEKKKLENELLDKKNEFDNVMNSMQLTRRESYELMDKLQQSEDTKDKLLRLQDAYKKLAIERHAIETDLQKKNKQIENLLQTLNKMKLSNEHLSHQCRQLDFVTQELENLKKSYDELLSEKNDIVKDSNAKKEALNSYYNMLEQKIEENRGLSEQIKLLQVNELAAKNSLQSLHENNLQTQATLNLVKKESAILTHKIQQYENIETDYDQLKKAHDEMKLEKEKLERELNTQLKELKRVEMQNYELHCHSQNLISHTEDLENALITSRTELIKSSTSPDNTYKNIIVEIEKLRQEKLVNQAKIRGLLDRLEESENMIANLSEEVWARNDRIAVLENHINQLEDEVRQLHSNLAKMVSTGEEMKDFSFEKIDTITNMEAHHSKAAHNMKMELAKLQQQNAILEEQLSVTKIKSEESSRDKNLYVSQLVQLRDEREIIVADIKDLEVTNMGESTLVPTTCTVEDILLSLDRIRKCLDARNSKSTFLEKTILKVQTSSQLLLSKADEAKRLVEKEKQKIASEKEDAIKDRQNMERQLLQLKEKLGEQITVDRTIIQNLEATISNQKLIIDKINESTQKYISKLKEDLDNLQDLYHNSMEKIGELQEQLQNMSEDRDRQKSILQKIKSDFEAKSLEVCELQETLEKLKNKPIANFGTQTKIGHHFKETQTDEKMNVTKKERKTNKLLTLEGHNKSTLHKRDTEVQTKVLNEVQVLTAKVEPSFDYVRNSYTKYKIKCLSTVKLEQYSISHPSVNEINHSPETFQENGQSYSNTEVHNSTLVDIFKIQSMNTNSSKVNNYSENDTVENSHNKSSSFFEIVTTDNKINGKYTHNKTATNLKPQKGNIDEDLFVIYKDSYANRDQENSKWSETAEDVTQSTFDDKPNDDLSNYQDLFSCTEKTTESNSPKHILKIKIPNIENESINSLITNTDGENRSLHSDKFVIYSSDTKIHSNKSDRIITSVPSLPTLSFDESLSHNKDLKDSHTIQRNNLKTKATADINKFIEEHKMADTITEIPKIVEQESHHKLSRVSANLLLLNAEKAIKMPEGTVQQNAHSFGLEFLLDSVNGKVTPNGTKHFTKETRSKSYEILSNIKNNADSSSTRPSDLKVTSNELDATIPLNNYPNKDYKEFTEQSVMVKLDTDTNYENALNSLTKALENIEMDYKKKIEAIKLQYDNNIRCIINEHNEGVKNMQGLHEDTLHDMMKIHENEVENLRSMSIEAMRKAEKLEKENRALKTKVTERATVSLYEEPIKICSPESKKRKKIRGETKMLSKTTVEAFDVKPKLRGSGPCTCTLDVNVSDTIRNIFDQVGLEQKKMAEETFTKYIANKIVTANIEALDGNELSFLHLKVCQMYKSKVSKEKALQKRIDSLESELINKQRNTHQHIVDLDRNLEEERRRLQELCEAVCRATPPSSLACSTHTEQSSMVPLASPPHTEDPFIVPCNPSVSVRRSAGDLGIKLRQRHNDRATTATLDVEERHREKKLYDEPPTRLRRSRDRQTRRK